MSTIRVLTVANIPLIREGLRALLANERDLDIATLAPSEDWLEDLLEQAPDVLMLDVQVLERDGWEVASEIVRAAPHVTMLILSDAPNDQRVAHALNLGARGYLLRDASADELASGIRAAYHGATVLHAGAAQQLLEGGRAGIDGTRDDPDEADERNRELIEPLSERELDVLRLMTRGMANKQIAGELFITEHTVKFHVRTILGKLGAANRTEAVTLALQRGLVNL